MVLKYSRWALPELTYKIGIILVTIFLLAILAACETNTEIKYATTTKFIVYEKSQR